MKQARGLSSDFLRNPDVGDFKEGSGAKALKNPSPFCWAGLGDVGIGDLVDDLVDVLHVNMSYVQDERCGAA